MKVALGVIAVVLILVLIVGGMYAGRRNEMVRLNESIGKTRVEFREQLAASEANLRGAISS